MRIRRAIAASVAAAAVLPVPAGAATGHYTVRWGDTLTWIARAHHIGLLRLARLNHIQPYGML
ncbi:MAG TPA: LysM domain-containing protein, partial [Gaiellales bacterium]|nr:LysM domain-containing protein [Gaiellales bacterium]